MIFGYISNISLQDNRISITPETRLNELMFGIKCDTLLYVIKFDKL